MNSTTFMKMSQNSVWTLWQLLNEILVCMVESLVSHNIFKSPPWKDFRVSLQQIIFGQNIHFQNLKQENVHSFFFEFLYKQKEN